MRGSVEADLLSDDGIHRVYEGITAGLFALSLKNALSPGLELLLHLTTVLVSTSKGC